MIEVGRDGIKTAKICEIKEIGSSVNFIDRIFPCNFLYQCLLRHTINFHQTGCVCYCSGHMLFTLLHDQQNGTSGSRMHLCNKKNMRSVTES